MSLLSSLFARPADEARNWLTDDDSLWAGVATASGVRVTRETALQLSTVWACVRLLTNTIATLPTDIVVSISGRRFREFTKPRWLQTPDPTNPTMTTTEHFAQVATSLLLDGNSFTLAFPSVMEPDVLVVLDPRRVDVKADGRRPYYEIRDDMGRVVETLDTMRILHGVWLRLPGTLRGLSPIEAARQGIGLGLTSEEFGARFFGQGTTLSYGVEYPGPMTDQQREELRSNLKQRHAGTKNAHSVSIISGGAKFVPGLGVTNDQAQFLELRKFQVEDIARWFGVPPHMVGSQEPGASSYNSVEQRSLEFREYAVLPLVRRIEDAYDRLVEPPATLTNATASLRFNLDGIARADIKTRMEAYGTGVTNGILKPDEARALEDLPPVEGGDKTYMQQQMVPLGTPPPAPAPAPAPPDDEDEDDRAMRVEVHNHLRADTLHVEPPVIPPFPAPVINMPAPVVNVEPPVVNVNVPEERTVEKRIIRGPDGRIEAVHEKRGRDVRRVEVDTDG